MKIKRLFSLLLTIALVLSLAPAAFATPGEGDTASGAPGVDTSAAGQITVNKAENGATYKIYRILNLESYNPDTKAYSYKPSDKWANWFNDSSNTATWKTYFEKNDAGYVTWKSGNDAANLAKELRNYLTSESVEIEPEDTKQATSTTVEFTNLDLGYYFLTSSVGSICSLDTTNPNATITDKNETRPYVDKKVQEDSKKDAADEGWMKVNDDDIGKTVNFKTTVYLKGDESALVLHDKMDAGFTFDSSSVKVKICKNPSSTEPNTFENVEDSNYTVKTTDLTDNCTFEITFNETWVEGLKDNQSDIEVTYSATLNSSANIGKEKGNDNETWLKWNNEFETEHDKTTTYTWEMSIYKYTTNHEATSAGTDLEDAATAIKTRLAGAEFIILRNDGTDEDPEYKIAELTHDTTNPEVYKVSKWSEYNENSIPDNSKITTVADKDIEVKGLDSDDYELKEIKAPDGYNKLKETKKFTVKDQTKKTDGSTEIGVTRLEVENKTGTELPETGGIGTALFIGIGSMLALAACVFLVTRKKMSVYAE